MSRKAAPSSKTLTIGRHEIDVGHPDRVYFPDPGYTKMQVLRYYAHVAERMALRTQSRPMALRRYPEGIAGKGFFQKRVGSYFPDWIPHAELPLVGGGMLDYVLGGDAAALVWLASLGTIEFHAMLCRADKPHMADQIIFDLDPPADYVDDVRLAALGLKRICDELNLASFIKSTGSRGFHVILPIERRHDFDVTRRFAKLIAARLMKAMPGKLSLDMRKAKRDKRILVDVWRNGYGQTAVAPYSVRARPGAPVAVPLRWHDLESPAVHPRAVTIANFEDYLSREAAPWPEQLGPASRMEKARAALEKD